MSVGRKPFPAYKPTHERAAEFLSQHGHSLGHGEWVVRQRGNLLQDGWYGPPVNEYRMQGRSAFGRTWCVSFMPGLFSLQLPADMTEAEVHEISANYIDLINIRRLGD